MPPEAAERYWLASRTAAIMDQKFKLGKSWGRHEEEVSVGLREAPSNCSVTQEGKAGLDSVFNKEEAVLTRTRDIFH